MCVFPTKHDRECAVLITNGNVNEYRSCSKIECISCSDHDDVIKWKHFPRNCPFVPGDLRRHRGHYDVIVMFRKSIRLTKHVNWSILFLWKTIWKMVFHNGALSTSDLVVQYSFYSWTRQFHPRYPPRQFRLIRNLVRGCQRACQSALGLVIIDKGLAVFWHNLIATLTHSTLSKMADMLLTVFSNEFNCMRNCFSYETHFTNTYSPGIPITTS